MKKALLIGLIHFIAMILIGAFAAYPIGTLVAMICMLIAKFWYSFFGEGLPFLGVALGNVIALLIWVGALFLTTSILKEDK